MQFCKWACKGKGPCIVMASIFTIFYAYTLWQTMPVDRGVFNLVAVLLGVALLVMWVCILAQKK